jgi:NAD(FAD)-utilizing enzyme possibly involved in translation
MTISTVPMDEPAYNAFYDALLAAEKVQPKEFEKTPYFEGCIPIEVMAERGRQTMQFGPLKPVGLRIQKRVLEPMLWCSSGRKMPIAPVTISWGFRRS